MGWSWPTLTQARARWPSMSPGLDALAAQCPHVGHAKSSRPVLGQRCAGSARPEVLRAGAAHAGLKWPQLGQCGPSRPHNWVRARRATAMTRHDMNALGPMWAGYGCGACAAQVGGCMYGYPCDRHLYTCGPRT